MAPTYIAHADQLKKDKQWDAAAVAYGKAHAVAPTGPSAGAALAGQFYARGRVLTAAGKDGSAMFRRALEHDSSHKGAAASIDLIKDSPATHECPCNTPAIEIDIT